MDFIEKEFTETELDMMNQVIIHATDGLGLGSWSWGENAQKVYLKTNPYQILRDRFFSFKVASKINAPENVWLDFGNAYREARFVLDEHEIQTLTSYTWEETGEVEKKIFQAISDNHK